MKLPRAIHRILKLRQCTKTDLMSPKYLPRQLKCDGNSFHCPSDQIFPETPVTCLNKVVNDSGSLVPPTRPPSM